MDITNLDKAEILTALYNNSKLLILGVLHRSPIDMTIKEAAELLKTQTYFDYLKGRLMKIDLSGNELRTSCYNLGNGKNAAENVINDILCSKVEPVSTSGTNNIEKAVESVLDHEDKYLTDASFEILDIFFKKQKETTMNKHKKYHFFMAGEDQTIIHWSDSLNDFKNLINHKRKYENPFLDRPVRILDPETMKAIDMTLNDILASYQLDF